MNLFRKLVILSHRYLGIAISLLVVMWFASGILMIYSGGMPIIAPQERLDRLDSLRFDEVRLPPGEAAARAGFEPGVGFDDRVVLLMVEGRPAYRFGGEATVFADDGQVLGKLAPGDAQAVAARFLMMEPEKMQRTATLERVDQWTLGLASQMPLDKFAAEDGAGSEVYVQPKTGEVVMWTTTRSRALAWLSTIPHWLYFTSLRANQPVWYQVVVWTSGLACVLAALGLTLSVTQFKRTRPFRLSAAIPYSGWMRWHYITGAIFGLFTLTWAFSGLLSMEPFQWTRAERLEVPRDTFTGGPLELGRFANIRGKEMATVNGTPASRGLQAACHQAVKEVELLRVQDEPYYLVRCGATVSSLAGGAAGVQPVFGLQERHLVSPTDFRARSEPFSAESLVGRLRGALPEAPIVEQQLLTGYDSYYYARRRQAPLPVLRVKFGDPAETWFYIDPEMSRVVAAVHRLSRVDRWLYSGLHDLDFSFWYDRRPLWDIVVIALLLGGLASSGIGLFLGIKRMWRAF